MSICLDGMDGAVRFNREYPHRPGFAKVIDNKINYAQDLVDQFTDPEKPPQIAISVDMLDNGIDVPECLNLVFSDLTVWLGIRHIIDRTNVNALAV